MLITQTNPARTGCLEKRWQAIRTKIEAAAHHLRMQGTVMPKVARGRQVWVIRYRIIDEGHKRYRSIYLGGDDQPDLFSAGS